MCIEERKTQPPDELTSILKMLEIIINPSMMPQIGGSNSLKNLDNLR